MRNPITAIAAFSLAITVILGAWNAHGMEQLVTSGQISARYMKTFHTGVEYQFYHSLGLLLLGLLYRNNWLKTGRRLLLLGMVVFCGSLYLVSLNEILGSGLKSLGMVAPVGGILLAAGWLFTGLAFIKNKN